MRSVTQLKKLDFKIFHFNKVRYMTGYIYRFMNRINGKVYIGQTTDLEARYKAHLYYANKNPVQQIHLAIKKYGIDNFNFEVLHTVEGDKDFVKHRLDELESHEILAHNSYRCGYNASMGGEGNTGMKHSAETKALLSKQSKERNAIKACQEANKGRPSNAKGKKWSAESRARLSAAKKGQVPWNKGMKKSTI